MPLAIQVDDKQQELEQVIGEWEELEKGKQEIQKWMRDVRLEFDAPGQDPHASPVVKRRQRLKVSRPVFIG